MDALLPSGRSPDLAIKTCTAPTQSSLTGELVTQGVHLQVQLLSKDSYQPLADIAISGMPGWATVLGAGRAAIQLRIWAPVGIEVFVRPPLPCPNPVFKAKC